MSSMTPMPTPPTPAMPPTTAIPATRPLGISIIAILALLSGVLGLCGATPLLGVSLIGVVIPTGVTQVLGGIGLVLGLFLVVGPLLEIIFAFGAWNLRPWAWWFGIIAMGVSVLSALLSIIGSGGAAIHTVLTHGLVPILIFVYLLTPGVRNVFKV